MAYSLSLYDYVDSTLVLKSPNILAIIGDRTANSKNNEDLDGIVIVREKRDIMSLALDATFLYDLLSIVPEERTPLAIDPWPELDGIRIGGKTATSSSKWVTILSHEFLSRPTLVFKLLSLDKRRVQEGKRPNGAECYLMQQLMQVDRLLSIVCEQLLYSTGNEAEQIFSPTANVIMTGTWLWCQEDLQVSIKDSLLRQLGFSNEIDYQKLFGWERHHSSRVPFQGDGLFLPNFSDEHCRRMTHTGIQITVPLDVERVDVSAMIHNSHPIVSPFSRASAAGWFTVEEAQVVPLKLLWKRSKFHDSHDAEIFGASLAPEFYPLVQRPIRTKSGELLYKFYEGRSQMEMRSSYIRDGRADTVALKQILTIELIKAEDMLRAYVQSFRQSMPKTWPRIHRLYYERAANGNPYFYEFYEDGINVGGVVLAPAEFAKLPIFVNDERYPSFSELTKTAEYLLHPSMFSAGFVFGLGDCHGGNVLIDNSLTDILYIDYEFADFQPVILDLVNSLFFDIFFEVMYNDAIGEAIMVHAELKNQAVAIEIKLNCDFLNTAIFETKMRCLIEPLFVFARKQGVELENSVEQLGHAFFVLATSKWIFPRGWKEFFARLAAGVVLSRIKRICDLRKAWEVLNKVKP